MNNKCLIFDIYILTLNIEHSAKRGGTYAAGTF